MTTDRRFAVLIDADNVAARYIKIILDEISNDGEVTYKRIYGDWTKPALAPWKQVLLEHSVTPIQQYSYTTGKNATDSAMIIDAMDILYSGKVEGYCLVTSDSDFTRLASRLRESGMMVVGMGEQKTPKPFVSACNKFKYLDILAGDGKQNKAKTAKAAKQAAKADEKTKNDKIAKQAKSGPKNPKVDRLPAESKKDLEKDEKQPSEFSEKASAAAEIIREPEKDPRTGKYNPRDIGILNFEEDSLESEITPLEDITDALLSILRDSSDEDGWVSTSDLGSRLQKRFSDFDVRNYGYPKLTPFLKSLRGFEMKSVRNENSSIKQVYLRELVPDRD